MSSLMVICKSNCYLVVFNYFIHLWHLTMRVCLLAILARAWVDIGLERVDHLVGSPEVVRN